MGPGDFLGWGQPVGGEGIGFLGVMVETDRGLLRLVVWTWENSSAGMLMPP